MSGERSPKQRQPRLIVPQHSTNLHSRQSIRANSQIKPQSNTNTKQCTRTRRIRLHTSLIAREPKVLKAPKNTFMLRLHSLRPNHRAHNRSVNHELNTIQRQRIQRNTPQHRHQRTNQMLIRVDSTIKTSHSLNASGGGATNSIVTAPRPLRLRTPLSNMLVPLSRIPSPIFSDQIVNSNIYVSPASDALYTPITKIIDGIRTDKRTVAIAKRGNLRILVRVNLSAIGLTNGNFAHLIRRNRRISINRSLVRFSTSFLTLGTHDLLALVIIIDNRPFA